MYDSGANSYDIWYEGYEWSYQDEFMEWSNYIQEILDKMDQNLEQYPWIYLAQYYISGETKCGGLLKYFDG